MKTYRVTEVVEYLVEAESAEAAEEIFVESSDPYDDFGIAVADRHVEEK